MKKLLRKIRNKRLKGNVSLLVILILLASSVISLLSINQIQRLLSYGNMTFNYFRAFYLAKAWTELWLTEVYNRWDGFSHRVDSWNIIISGNLVWIYTGFEPYFDMTITWSFYTLTDDIKYSSCEWNKIRLTSGAGIMLPLFSDDAWNKEVNMILSDYSWVNKDSEFENLSFDDSVHWEWWSNSFTFWLFDYDDNGNMNNIVVTGWSDLKNFLQENIGTMDIESRKYLTIKNPWTWNEVAEFCIKNNDNKLIPYSDFLITVFWHYGDMEVWIQSVVKKWVPDWTLNVIGEPAN